jgi:hypothetical protein
VLGVATGSAQPAGTSGGGLDLAIERAVIEGGTLTYRDTAAGLEQKLENLNVTLRLDSLRGPFDADGGLTTFGVPLGFSVKTARIEPNKPIVLDLAVKSTEANADLRFAGQIDAEAAADPTRPMAIGKLAAKGDNLAKLLELVALAKASNLPPLVGQPFSVDGEIQAGRATAKVENLTATLGSVTAKAGVAASYEADPIVQANIAIGRLDLDQLLPPPAQGGPSTGAQSAPGFSLPSGITAGADIAVQQIAYRGQAIDDAHLLFQLADGQVQVTKASAKLPGSSAGELSGVLSAEEGRPSFVGGVKLDSDNLRALVDAFQPGVLSSVPSERLRRSPSRRASPFLLNGLNSPTSRLPRPIASPADRSRLGGRNHRTKPGFGVGLSVDKINLDGYLPESSEPEGAESVPPAAIRCWRWPRLAELSLRPNIELSGWCPHS